MASPQIENGYTRIANELLEGLARQNLSPYESRVLFAVLRKTYGYNKKVDKISLSQLDDITKIGRVAVSKSIKKLEEKHVLLVDRGARIPSLSLNKNYDEWGKHSQEYSYRDTRPWYRKTERCEFCKAVKYKHRHHMIPKSEGGKDKSENYAYVCEKCHERIHRYMDAHGITGHQECQEFYATLIKLLSANLTTSIWPYLSAEQTTLVSAEQTTKVSAKQTTTKERKTKKETITKETSKTVVLQGAEWNKLIDAFEPLNPFFEDFYRNKTERNALESLVTLFGYDKVLNTIVSLPEVVAKPYAPKITKPTELKRDLGKLLIFMQQADTTNTSKTNLIANIS